MTSARPRAQGARGRALVLPKWSKCDLKHSEAKWDLDDPHLSWKAAHQREQAEFNAELHAKPWKDGQGS